MEAPLPLDDDAVRRDLVHDAAIPQSEAGFVIVGVQHDRRADGHAGAETRREVPCSHGVHTGIMRTAIGQRIPQKS